MDREIIGGGLAGLSLARELEKRGIRATIFETRSRLGGIFVIDRYARKEIEKIAPQLDVRLNSTAVLRRGVTIVSEDAEIRPRRAIVATGYRVRTPAELGIVGDRPAGVFPFHAAVDLLLEGLDIGRRVAIYGISRHSLSLAEMLLERSREVVLIGKGNARAPGDVELVEGKVRALKGTTRLEEVVTDGGKIEADAIVIAQFAPWNPFPPLPAVGQAAETAESPELVMLMSELFAENEACDGERIAIKLSAKARIFPPEPKSCLDRLLVFAEGPVEVDGHRYEMSGGYSLVRIRGDAEVRAA